MTVLLRLLVAAALLCASGAAFAQKTKAALTTEINANWPDNHAAAITPALLRSTVLDIVNSYVDANGASSLPCAAHQWIAGIPTLSSVTCAQPDFSDLSGQAALTQLPTIGANTVLGSIAGGTPAALSQAQLTALINPATATLPGALPAWPNNTTTFLRGDGTYQIVNPAAGGTGLDNSAAATNDVPVWNGSGFIHTALLTVTNAVCTLTPGTCTALFGHIEPEWFGDGVPCSASSALGIQLAYNYLGAHGGGTVRLANCSYAVSGPINMNLNYVGLEGQGGAYSSSSRIVFTPTGTNQCAINVGAGAAILSNNWLRHLTIATNDTTTLKQALCVSDGSTIPIQDVFIRGFTGGLVGIITGAANSGTGEIRLTVPGAAANWNDGWAVAVSGVAGTVEANFGWTSKVSGANTIDLPGSKFVNAFASSTATFTGTGSGYNLTTSAVTGTINLGAGITGTGVPSNTLILSQTSGTTGGAGVYVTSQPTTASGASITSNAVITASSTGIHLSGRELYTVSASVSADLPMRISPNPNVAGGAESLDESNFHNMTLAQAVGTNCIIMFDPGTEITSDTWDGVQSWGGGKSGVCWRDNITAGISEQVRFDNVRQEQQTVTGGFLFDIEPHNTLYSLYIVNPLISSTNGIFLRNIGNWQLDAAHWLNGSGVCLDIDATVQNTQINGSFWLAGTSTANLVGQTNVYTSGVHPAGGCLPWFAIYHN